MTSEIMGIDPGLDGGIVVLSNGIPIKMYKMPTEERQLTTKHTKGKNKGQHKSKRFIVTRSIINILDAHPDAKIFIEKAGSIFGIDANSNFRIGYSIGLVHGAIEGLGRSWKEGEVTSKAWQKEIWEPEDLVHREKITDRQKRTKTSSTDTKATSENAAARIFSGVSFVPKGCKKPHDGWVDAALVAEYGRRQQ